MPAKKNVYCLEVSDIFESEQEDFVIETIKPYIKEDRDALKEYFEKTDTIEVKRLEKEEAEKLKATLIGKDLVVRMYNIEEKKEEQTAAQVRCPKCGYILEFSDWRCPECYYEFPDYEPAENEEE
jgi:rubrerythrin